MPVYPLATTALGAGREIPAESVNHSTAWMTFVSSGPRINVELRKHINTIHVVGPDGYLGSMPADFLTKYPDFQRVYFSRLVPQTQVWMSPSVQGHMRIKVQLPAPPFAVPVGKIPSAAEVLDQGGTIPLEPTREVEAICQMLVELQAVGERVVALFNDHLLAGITHPSADFLHAVRTRTLAARAYFAQGKGALDVSPYFTSHPVPALSAPEPPVLHEEQPASSSGIVMVHTSHMHLIDPHRKN